MPSSIPQPPKLWSAKRWRVLAAQFAAIAEGFEQRAAKARDAERVCRDAAAARERTDLARERVAREDPPTA